MDLNGQLMQATAILASIAALADGVGAIAHKIQGLFTPGTEEAKSFAEELANLQAKSAEAKSLVGEYQALRAQDAAATPEQ